MVEMRRRVSGSLAWSNSGRTIKCDAYELQSNQQGDGGMSKSVAEREDRGRVDEFRVASELCRRKMFAALTIGNVPN